MSVCWKSTTIADLERSRASENVMRAKKRKQENRARRAKQLTEEANRLGISVHKLQQKKFEETRRVVGKNREQLEQQAAAARNWRRQFGW